MTEPSPTVLIVETSADEECPVEFLGDSAELVYFLSFAHAERYGANHPLAKASAIMKHRLGLKLGPLLKFGDARPDDPGEGQLLESLWQEAQPLADAVAGGGEIDWAAQYGPDWAQRIQGYARKLASHPQLRQAFTLDPWKGFAVKTA